MNTRQPLGLYVHIPFCETKCGYCDFYSVETAGRDFGAFIDRLLIELTIRTTDHIDRFTTIFVGGGTPTILPPQELQRLADALGPIAIQSNVEEFTVEANPASLDDEKMAILKSAGVDRISFGVQSFHESELAFLERLHTPADIVPSVKVARNHGIARLNLDLIFGIPGQTMQTWADTLSQAIDLNPDHLSCYALTYEPATRLTAQLDRNRFEPCDEALEADMFEFTIDQLAANNFHQYEISAYAKPNQQSRHNLVYWRNENYIGVGPSAAGYFNDIRYKNVADVSRYQRMIDETGTAVLQQETPNQPQSAAETAMLNLRLNEGINTDHFRTKTGLDPRECFADAIRQNQLTGLIETTETCIKLTRKGRLLADTVIQSFFDEVWDQSDRQADKSDYPLPIFSSTEPRP
jgi:oxygen-independent coproporphyrinogen-3 oxidase